MGKDALVWEVSLYKIDHHEPVGKWPGCYCYRESKWNIGLRAALAPGIRFAEPNVALRTRGRGRSPRQQFHK